MQDDEDRVTKGLAIFDRLRAATGGEDEPASDSAPGAARRSDEATEVTDRAPSIQEPREQRADKPDAEPQRAPWAGEASSVGPSPSPPTVHDDDETGRGEHAGSELPPLDLSGEGGGTRERVPEGEPAADDPLAAPSAQVDVTSVSLEEDLRVEAPAEPSVEAGPAPGPEAATVLAEPPEAPAFAPSAPPARVILPLPRVLAVANQKGGVGKTTTTVNLGAALAELGYRVLIVDLDPQGNATTGLGVNARTLETSVYDVLMHDLPLEDAVEPSGVRNLFVVPATIDLAGAEIELVPAFSRELKLKRALAGVGDDYDYTLIDCPPSLGLLTVNALAAATEVLVPIQCEYYALEGLGQLLRNVQLVQSNLNPTLDVSTIILTMYDARTKLADQVAAEVRQHFGPKVCRHVVPRTVRLSEAPSFGQPIIVFDPSSRGAIAYRELAKEVSGGPA